MANATRITLLYKCIIKNISISFNLAFYSSVDATQCVVASV